MENKNEILSNLYALRAGMSVISQEKDKVEQVNKTIQKHKQNSSQITAKIQEKINDVNQEINRLNNLAHSTHANPKKYATRGEVVRPYLIKFSAFAAIALGVCLTTVILNIALTLALGVEIFLLSLCVLSIVKAALSGKEYHKMVSERYKSINKYIKSIHDAPAQLVETRKQLEPIQQSLKNENLELNKKIQESNIQIDFYRQKSQRLISAMQAEHENVLDIRDWHHIDLIIFYFETGRADNIKEALQLVDRQVQNNAIVSAINTAGVQIQNTIRTGLQDLQTNMVKCFAHISGQLDEISQGISVQNAQLAQISQGIDLGNALKEKANTNSIQLMQDVNYMRNLAENAEVRRRNNM